MGVHNFDKLVIKTGKDFVGKVPTEKGITWVEPRFRKSIRDGGSFTSDNWSGGFITPASGVAFNSVQGTWNIPTVDVVKQNDPEYSFQWCGIDGVSGGDVVQAGSAAACLEQGGQKSFLYTLFAEWFPNGAVDITNIAVAPGNEVYVLIDLTSPTSAYVVMYNRTTGFGTYFTMTPPAGTQALGNSAEWINETPVIGGVLSTMPAYTPPVVFNGCSATDNKGNSTSVGTGSTLNLVQNGVLLSEGKITSPVTVQCTYKGPPGI